MTRTVAALLLAGALAASPALAEDPGQAESPPALRERAPLDITGRLRTTADGLSLEVGGARLELRLSGDRLALEEPAPPGGHDLRASFSLDGRTANLVLRFVPPRGGERQP